MEQSHIFQRIEITKSKTNQTTSSKTQNKTTNSNGIDIGNDIEKNIHNHTSSKPASTRTNETLNNWSSHIVENSFLHNIPFKPVTIFLCAKRKDIQTNSLPQEDFDIEKTVSLFINYLVVF